MQPSFVLVCEFPSVGYVIGYLNDLEEADVLFSQHVDLIEQQHAAGLMWEDIVLPYRSYRIHRSQIHTTPLNAATSLTNGFYSLSAIHIPEDFSEQQWCWERGHTVFLFGVQDCDFEKNRFLDFSPDLIAN